MLTQLRTFWRDKGGAMAAEYALTVALLSIGVTAGAQHLGAAIVTCFTVAADALG